MRNTRRRIPLAFYRSSRNCPLGRPDADKGYLQKLEPSIAPKSPISRPGVRIFSLASSAPNLFVVARCVLMGADRLLRRWLSVWPRRSVSDGAESTALAGTHPPTFARIDMVGVNTRILRSLQPVTWPRDAALAGRALDSRILVHRSEASLQQSIVIKSAVPSSDVRLMLFD